METNLSLIFGQRLKDLRERRNYNQEDVGMWFEMGKSTVSQWEGGRIPHATILVKLANKLGVSVDYLLGNNDTGRSSSLKLLKQEIQLDKKDLDLLQQIKQASADKQKAIELILGIKEQSATATK